jgi:hypothetical protein
MALRHAGIGVASLLAAMTMQAQGVCIDPGSAFGVTGYQCASCSFRREGATAIWQFGAEPVVTAVTEWSVLKPGDVVLAIDGRPITTAEGARLFVSPPSAQRRVRVRQFAVGRPDTTVAAQLYTSISVRRNGANTALSATARCDGGVVWLSRPGDTVQVRGDSVIIVDGRPVPAGGRARGGGAGRGEGLGVRGGSGRMDLSPAMLDSMRARLEAARAGAGGRGLRPDVRDSSRDQDVVARVLEELDNLYRALERTGRFGIAVSCSPSCNKVSGADGIDYWKYDVAPTIAEVRKNSPAERAGLVAGDMIVSVDGIPIYTDAGSHKLAQAMYSATEIRLVVRRGAQEFTYQLQAPLEGGRGGRGGRARGAPPPLS